ncbi:unnamed protein product, partial [Prorocentrum cordatum]
CLGRLCRAGGVFPPWDALLQTVAVRRGPEPNPSCPPFRPMSPRRYKKTFTLLLHDGVLSGSDDEEDEKAPSQPATSHHEQRIGDALEELQLRLEAVIAGSTPQHGLELEDRARAAEGAEVSPSSPAAGAGGGGERVHQEAPAPEPDDLADWLRVREPEDDLASLAGPAALPGSGSATTCSSSDSTCRTSEAPGSDRSDDWLVVE